MTVGVVEVYAAPGKRGDKIWCGLEQNGNRCVAWGATDFHGLAQNGRGVLEFSRVSRNTKKPVWEVQREKISKGYRLVGRYEVDFRTGKAARIQNQAVTTPSGAEPVKKPDTPAPTPAPAQKPPKIIMKRPSTPLWAW